VPVGAFALPAGSARAAAARGDTATNRGVVRDTDPDPSLAMTAIDRVAGPAVERSAREVPPPRRRSEPLALADGVELIGEYEGSGFKEPPLLARRADGQMIQLSRLLYLVAEACDGRRDAETVAAVVTEQYGRRVSARNVCHIVDRKLRPLGVLALADGTTPSLPKREPVMALRHRKPIVSERYVNAVARAFVWLHRPRVQLVFLALLAAFDVWLFGVHGVAGGLRAVLYSPVLLLGVLASIVVATAFHEIGHASACRHGGARPGVMGVGIYLVWPAFYCDVTEAYRLNRPARLRTDLGGVYFNGLFALLAGLAWAATGQEALLLVAFIQHTIVLQQLLPLLRFDGYYVLSDLTGVPDILSRVKPIFRSLVPRRPPEPRVQELKPWVRVVVTAYLLVLLPTLLFMIASTVIAAPRMAATAFDSLGLQLDRLHTAHGAAEVALGAVQIGALLLPLGAIAVSISRSGRMGLRAVTAWSRGSAPRRAVAIAGAAALVAGLAYVWWPHGEYQPIRPGERGTIGDALRGVQAIPRDRPSFAMERAALVGSVPPVGESGAAQLRPAAGHASAPESSPAVEPGGGDPPASEPGEPKPSSDLEPGGDSTPPAVTSSPSPDQAAPTATTGPTTAASSRATAAPAAVTPAAPAGSPPATAPPSAPPADVTSPPATSGGASGSNTAVADNTTDGGRVVRIAFDLAWFDGPRVDPVNVAIAIASCTSCTTVAIAIQAVVVFGQPRVFMPTNVAVALNESCTDCQTLASAHQDVIQLTAPAHLSAAGMQQVEAVRRALAALAESGLPIAEIQQRVETLHRDLIATLATELLPDEASTPLPEPASSTEPSGSAPSAPPAAGLADASASPPAVEQAGTKTVAPQPGTRDAPEAPPAEVPDRADDPPPVPTTDPAPVAGGNAPTVSTPASEIPAAPVPSATSTQAAAPASATTPTTITTAPTATTPSQPPADAAPPAPSTTATTDPPAPPTTSPPPTTTAP
jgi:putative peptide zinc metalloprotease protein